MKVVKMLMTVGFLSAASSFAAQPTDEVSFETLKMANLFTRAEVRSCLERAHIAADDPQPFTKIRAVRLEGRTIFWF